MHRSIKKPYVHVKLVQLHKFWVECLGIMTHKLDHPFEVRFGKENEESNILIRNFLKIQI